MIGTIAPETGGRDLAAFVKTISEHPDDAGLIENEQISKEGKSLWIRWSSRPVYDSDGTLIELLCVGQDITEHRLLEQQVMQQQKMEEIGMLAGGIAHDFNNMLVPIFGYAELIRMKSAPQDNIHTHAGSILDAAENAKRLVRQLLSFSRKQILSTEQHDLNEIINSFMSMLRRTIRENIEILQNLNPAPCPVNVDRSKIEQVLLNLAVNAQDAIDGNGRIAIETGHLTLDDEYCRLHPGAAAGRHVLLAFSDTGSGMDEATLSRIFEPFFTTKGVGHGTGLGLSTVYGIIKQHGGYIEAQSTPGHGTFFRIYLPLHAGANADTAKRETLIHAEAGKNSTGTILLVEDNRMVMDISRELLINHGHTVLTTDSPAEALMIARDQGTQIDLLVSDVVMPEMSGPELHERLTRIIPGMKVLFMSGYSDKTAVYSDTLREGVNLIRKPFTADEFMNRFSELL